MPTRLTRCSDAWLGAGVLVTLAVTPLVFSIALIEPFELAKASALQWLALLLLPVVLVRILQPWRQDPLLSGRRRTGFLLLLGAFLAIVVLSTLTSAAPWISLWGSVPRAYGALTLAALLVVCAAAASLDQDAWRARAVRVVLATSLPAFLYWLLQRQGQDPVEFGGGRLVPSFFGNPNWLGAWGVMAVPLTGASLVEAWRAEPTAGGRALRGLRIGVLTGLLSLQLYALGRLGARGAQVGVSVALVFLLLLLASSARPRRTMRMLTSGCALAFFLIALLILSPAVKTMTARQRLVIWDTTLRLVGATPARVLTGHGLDTLGFVIGPVYPEDPASQALLGVGQVWDRAHSVLLDLLATVGVAGALLFLLLLGAVVRVALGQLGMLRTAAEHRAALLASLGGGLIAAVPTALLAGRPGPAIPAFCLGLLGGLALVLWYRAWWHTAPGSGPGPGRAPDPIRLSGVLAAILGHFAELQFGFQVVSSAVLFWVCAGLIVGGDQRAGPEEVGHSRQRPRGHAPPSAPSTAWEGVADGLLVGTVVAAAAASLLTPTARWSDWRILALLGATGLGGTLIAVGEASPRREPGAFRRGLIAMVGASTLWSAVGLFVVASTRGRPLTLGPLPLFAFLTTTVLLLAAVTLRRPAAGQRRGSSWWARLGLTGLVVASLPVAYQVAVVPMLADASALVGRWYLTHEDPDKSGVFLRRALALAPWRDYYGALLADAYMARARRASAPDPWLRHAEAVLLRAMRLNPVDPTHALHLSALYALWAERVPSERARLADSRRYALVAVRVDPVRSAPAVEARLMSILMAQGAPVEAARAEARRLIQEARRPPP